MFNAAQALKDEPVEFWIVEAMQITVPNTLRSLPNVPWFGQSRRNTKEEFDHRANILCCRHCRIDLR